MSATRRRLLGLVLALGASLPTTMVRAEPSPTDVVIAQSAFDSARDLFRDGKYKEASEKFALSQKLDPKLGTLLDLAICHAKQGKVAAAWSEFHDARSVAAAAHRPDRVEFAEQQMAALAPLLSYLRVRVSPTARAAHVVVKVDGARLDEAAYETDLPVDPGDHRVSAEADGYRAWSLQTRAAPGTSDVNVPDLERATTTVTTPPAHRPGVGIALTAVGVVGAALGATFGVIAVNKRHDAEQLCLANRCAEGRSANAEGQTYAWAADIAIVAGAVTVATGVILLLVDLHRHKVTPVHVAPSSLTLSGKF